MRYYCITITDPTTGKLVTQYSSLMSGSQANTSSGTHNPSALNVEFDITITDYTSPSNAWLRIWGIAITDIAQAAKFNKMSITVYGGMSKGLPLANPAEQGVLVQGTIFQAFGNWQGTNMTLDFVIIPTLQTATSGNQAPQTPNIVVNWKKGQSLTSALTQTLNTAFPGVTVDCQISPNLILGYNEQSFFQNLQQLATFCDGISKDIVNSETYLGVKIILQKGKFVIRDGTTQSKPLAIAFNDLIGQITLAQPGQISMDAVLRGDLAGADYISVPPGQVITSSSSYSSFRQGSIFTGVYQINYLRHVGNFRQKDAESWVTSIIANGPYQQTTTT